MHCQQNQNCHCQQCQHHMLLKRNFNQIQKSLETLYMHQPYSHNQIYEQKLMPIHDNWQQQQQSELSRLGRLVLGNNQPLMSTTYQQEYHIPKCSKINNPQLYQFALSSPHQDQFKNTIFQGESIYKSHFKQPTNFNQPQKQYMKNYQNHRNYQEERASTAPAKRTAHQLIPSLHFEGVSTYSDHYQQIDQKHRIRNERCPAQLLPIPSVNCVNKLNHIYYDSQLHIFI